jgi:hypothetical protein
MHVTDTDIEPFEPAYLPPNAQAILQAMTGAGNVAHIDDEAKTVVAGTPEQPSPAFAIDAGMMGVLVSGMVAGERGRLLTTRLGRHFARHGTVENFDDSITDVDLAEWGQRKRRLLHRGAAGRNRPFHGSIALNRREALDILIERRVIRPDEARKDVTAAERPSPTLSSVDVAAWARGQTERLFAEVRWTLRKDHGITVTNRRSAVEAIIEAGLIDRTRHERTCDDRWPQSESEPRPPKAEAHPETEPQSAPPLRQHPHTRKDSDAEAISEREATRERAPKRIREMRQQKAAEAQAPTAGNAPAREEAPHPAAPEEVFILKVDGREEKVSREELTTRAQKHTASDNRLDKAKRLLQEAMEAAKTLHGGPPAAPEHQAAGNGSPQPAAEPGAADDADADLDEFGEDEAPSVDPEPPVRQRRPGAGPRP